MSAFYRVGKWS